MDRLHVELGDRGYDILIGSQLLARAGGFISEVAPKRRAIIITDTNVRRHCLPPLEQSLSASNIPHTCITLPAGEETKSFSQLGKLLEDILTLTPDRDTLLIALGGGVIGDITGFAASIVLRGLDFIQVPTTLLSQVDSSVGGKTGINARQGKNLIGSFHQPKRVLIDTDALTTLPPRELRAGYAEVVKYGIINHPDFFDWLERNGASTLTGNRENIAHMIRVSCAAKAAIVAQDEREGGVRALLNLGHTFGHALEAETGFSQELLHGEGVAIGMNMAMRFSVYSGLCNSADAARVEKHLRIAGLPVSPHDIRENWDTDTLLAHMAHDKKAKDGRLTFILARGIGASFVAKDIPPEKIRAWLNAYLHEKKSPLTPCSTFVSQRKVN